MNTYNTLDELKTLIENQEQENTYLEYKSSGYFDLKNPKKASIVKAITGMANGGGGTVICGIKEYDDKEKAHLPEKFDPISNEFSKERLEDIINSNTSPKLTDFTITPIPFDNTSSIYIVDIKQSTTAHQNTVDHKYYKRRNFKTEPMIGYEVEDVMNRRRYSDVVLIFYIAKNHYKKPIYTNIRGDEYDVHYPEDYEITEDYVYDIEHELQIYAENIGTLYAKYIKYYARVPKSLLYNEEEFTPEDEELVVGDNMKVSVIREPNPRTLHPGQFGDKKYQPLLPGDSMYLKSIKMNEEVDHDNAHSIKYQLYADNAKVKELEVFINEIEVIDIYK
jgi:hypothetical protein